MKILLKLLIAVLIANTIYAQSILPKREFRGVWITTVLNLDWPSSKTASSAVQKQELIDMLDELRISGFNAVIFQVRPEGDAFYNSAYEPWSYWLTGHQGHAPSPYYDPLEFALEETHKRGMELHAWFNPYQAVRSVGSYNIHSSHVTVEHPEWVIAKNNKKYLDPGLPDVRDYITTVIMDVVYNYDVDGVHFDDYFYPEGMYNSDDQETFNDYPNGFTDRGNWRRNNVNLLVEQVHNEILDSKPNIKFGIAPPGIWKYGVPEGIIGGFAYSGIFCDALAWLDQLIIDYINPQIYWEIGSDTDYATLASWWKDQSNGRHVYSGNSACWINQKDYAADEIPRQIRYNRNTANLEGSVMYRTRTGVLDNQKGFNDSLKTDLFRYPALIPSMDWKDLDPPNAPQNLIYTFLEPENSAALKWDVPETAADGDSARRYVVYRFNSDNFMEDDLQYSQNIISIEGNSYSIPDEAEDAGPYYFVVTALDQNWNEGGMSNAFHVNAPKQPVLAAPLNLSIDQRDTVIVSWDANYQVSSYQLQISEDSDFSGTHFVEQQKMTDTSFTVTDMDGLRTYYWRVLARNAGGTSSFTEPFSFKTGFPVQAQLVYPEHKSTNIERTPTLFWQNQTEAETYCLQAATSNYFTADNIVVDTTGLADTTITLAQLQATKYHYWRVKAVNEFGEGLWSESYRFKTNDITGLEDPEILPASLRLAQNYPNPFNPVTTIKFTAVKSGRVQLNVYDIQGRLIKNLVDEAKEAGEYSVRFNGTNLATGIYIYELRTKNKTLRKKMTLIK